jgi:hypothetical protein
MGWLITYIAPHGPHQSFVLQLPVTLRREVLMLYVTSTEGEILPKIPSVIFLVKRKIVLCHIVRENDCTFASRILRDTQAIN